MPLSKLPTIMLSLGKGCSFNQETLDLSNDRLTNLYWLEIETNGFNFSLLNSVTPRPPVNHLRSFARSSRVKILGGINTNQFFLSDDKIKPKISSYNLFFKNGKILQFSANKRPTIIEQDGKISLLILDAKGKVNIGEERIDWVGSACKNLNNKNFVVYGSIDIDIKKLSSKNRSRRVIDKKSLKISCSKNQILIGFESVRGTMVVTKIARSAYLNNHSFIFKGNFKNLGKIKIGNKIENFEIDGIAFTKETNAVSCVLALPSVKAGFKKNIKKFLLPGPKGQYLVFSDKYIKSWSVVLKTKNKIIFFINDGNPHIKNEMGLSIIELYDLLLNKFKFDLAFVCDAEQSSKLCIKREKFFSAYGNMHYLDYSNILKPRKRALYGRSVPSTLVVYK